MLAGNFFLPAQNVLRGKADPERHVLFDNGSSSYCIVVDPEAPASEQYAAAELRDWLGQVSGAELPICGLDGGEPGKRLVVGYNSLVSELVPDSRPQPSSDDSFTWCSKGGDILFWGGSERGTLYSVYDFLEDALGCRWYTPEVSVAPRKDNWSFMELHQQESPGFLVRDNCTLAARTDLVFSARLRNNINPLPGKKPGESLKGTAEGYWGVHAMAGYITAAEYFEEHPEYFGVKDGERFARGGEYQLCLSNPDVLRICIDKLRKVMREHPDYMVYSMEQLDNENPCQCERCQALARQYGGESGVMIWFVNQVADAVKEEFPDKYVGTFAYRYTRKAPVGIVPRDNVVIRLCSIECCLLHGYDECEENLEFAQDMKEWAAIAPNLYIWDYVTDFSLYCLPVANFRTMQPHIRDFIENNAIGILEQGDYQTRTCELKELRTYLVSKLLWNPDVDVDSVITDFTDGYYGPAGKYIRKYIDYADSYLRRPGMHTDCYAAVSHPMFTPEFVREAAGIFAEAGKAVEDDPVYLERVRTSELPILLLQLELTPAEGIRSGAHERFKQIMSKDKVAHLDEWGTFPAAPYVEYLDNLAASLANAPELMAADTYASAKGISFTRYEGDFTSTVQMIESGRVTDKGRMGEIVIESDKDIDHFGYVFEGLFKAEQDGLHLFRITTDDGAVMLIDGKEVFNRDGSHSAMTGWAAVNLQKGYHNLTVRYFDDSEGQTLDIYLVSPDGYEGPLSSERLFVGPQRSEPFWNPDLPMQERLDDLVSRLTLEEKVSQMINSAPAIPRLGIPAYDWWNEALHGIARTPYATTSYPQAIGIAATWDREAVEQMAEYISDEGRAIYNESERLGKPGRFKGLTYWSPNINIFRDPRWGRGQETYGEDPYLTGEIGSAFVKGIQGDDPEYLKASACAKHYAVHSGPEWNRHTFDAYVSDYDLWDTYLPAFGKLVTEAGVTGVMTAYNSFLGQACSTNDVLMTDILFNKWNYQGYVTSDCGGIDDVYMTHKQYEDAASGSAAAVKHGNHCECGSGKSYRALVEAVERGLIDEEEIDKAVRKLFEIRMRLGMFDPVDRVPYSDIPMSVLECDKHKEYALEMARKSMVLLKNEDGLLPLDRKKISKIAVVGPNADNENIMLANYFGYPSEITTVLEGIKAKAGSGIEVVYDKGVNLVDEYVFVPVDGSGWFSIDGQRGFKAEYFQNMNWEGVSPLVRYEERLDYRWGNAAELGNGIVADFMTARYRTVFTAPADETYCFELHADDDAKLLIDGKVPEKTGFVHNYYLLEAQKGKTYDIEILFSQEGDTAELLFDIGHLHMADYGKLASSVADADVIIYAGGLSSKLEGEEMSVRIDGFDRGDRTSIALPGVQRKMLEALVSTGKPVVFVLMTGSAVGLEWENENIPAILNAWYGGQAGGEAVADILFGDFNPSGKLPVTFYGSVEDLPDFEDYSMKDRTYRYFKGTPVYAFGHGLSYTSFKFGKGKVVTADDGTREFVVKVRNTGKRDGETVVQLYVSRPDAPQAPIKALKGFAKVELKAGQETVVRIPLTDEAFFGWNEEEARMEPVSGKYVLLYGETSDSKGLEKLNYFFEAE